MAEGQAEFRGRYQASPGAPAGQSQHGFDLQSGFSHLENSPPNHHGWRALPCCMFSSPIKGRQRVCPQLHEGNASSTTQAMSSAAVKNPVPLATITASTAGLRTIGMQTPKTPAVSSNTAQQTAGPVLLYPNQLLFEPAYVPQPQAPLPRVEPEKKFKPAFDTHTLLAPTHVDDHFMANLHATHHVAVEEHSRQGQKRLSFKHGASSAAIEAAIKELAASLQQDISSTCSNIPNLTLGNEENYQPGAQASQVLAAQTRPIMIPHARSAAGTVHHHLLKAANNQVTRLEDYFKLGPELGRGHFGVVRVGEDMLTREKFAVKSISRKAIKRQEDVGELQAEVLLLLKLQGNPFTLSLTELFIDASEVHLVMEYCPGGDLFDYIARKKRLTEKEAAAIFKQLVLAVHGMHENGIVHRDLKPENILLGSKPHAAAVQPTAGTAAKFPPEGMPFSPKKKLAESHNKPVDIRVADFGLALQLERGQQSQGMAGSPFYMAPEIIQGKKYSHEIDIWSMGVVLYTAIAGVLPFYGKTANDVFAAATRGSVDFNRKPWPNVSAEAKHLIQRMLTLNPSKRISTADIFHHPWLRKHCPEPLVRIPKPPSYNSLQSLAKIVSSEKSKHHDAGNNYSNNNLQTGVVRLEQTLMKAQANLRSSGCENLAEGKDSSAGALPTGKKRALPPSQQKQSSPEENPAVQQKLGNPPQQEFLALPHANLPPAEATEDTAKENDATGFSCKSAGDSASEAQKKPIQSRKQDFISRLKLDIPSPGNLDSAGENLDSAGENSRMNSTGSPETPDNKSPPKTFASPSNYLNNIINAMHLKGMRGLHQVPSLPSSPHAMNSRISSPTWLRPINFAFSLAQPFAKFNVLSQYMTQGYPSGLSAPLSAAALSNNGMSPRGDSHQALDVEKLQATLTSELPPAGPGCQNKGNPDVALDVDDEKTVNPKARATSELRSSQTASAIQADHCHQHIEEKVVREISLVTLAAAGIPVGPSAENYTPLHEPSDGKSSKSYMGSTQVVELHPPSQIIDVTSQMEEEYPPVHGIIKSSPLDSWRDHAGQEVIQKMQMEYIRSDSVTVRSSWLSHDDGLWQNLEAVPAWTATHSIKEKKMLSPCSPFSASGSVFSSAQKKVQQMD